MGPVERLAAIDEIGRLKARYCRFVDTRQWSAFRELFTADAQFDAAASGMGDVPDLDSFVAGARRGLDGCISVHHCHCPEIGFLSPDHAHGVWAMEDRLLWRGPDNADTRTVHGFGHYFEEYRKVGGEWKISRWRLARLRVDVS